MKKLSQQMQNELISDYQSKQFKNQELLEKYNISKPTFYNYLKINKVNKKKNSIVDECNESSQSSESQQSQISQSDSNQSQVSLSESIAIEHYDKYKDDLDKYLNSDNIIEQKVEQEEKIIQLNDRKFSFGQQQNVQQIVQQVPVQEIYCINNDIDAKNIIVKIRNLINFFSDEPCMLIFIGSKNNILRYQQSLHGKTNDELMSIYQKMEFELLFSRSNTFINDSIEQICTYGEKILSYIGIDTIGCYQEMKSDPDFDFYMKMVISDSSFLPNAKQILFMKFVKNYYQKYSENKKNKIANLDSQSKSEIVDKYKDLLQ